MDFFGRFFCLHFRPGIFLNGPFPASFSLIFVFSIQLKVNNVQYKCLPMTGFKLRTSGIGSDRSTNWATTTAQSLHCYKLWVCRWHNVINRFRFNGPFHPAAWPHSSHLVLNDFDILQLCAKSSQWRTSQMQKRDSFSSLRPIGGKASVLTSKVNFQDWQNTFRITPRLQELAQDPWSNGYGRRLAF